MFWLFSIHTFAFYINRLQTVSALGCPFCLNFAFPISLVPWWIPSSVSEGQAKAMLRWFLLAFSLQMQGIPTMSQAGLALVKHKLLLGSSRQRLWPCWSLQAGDGTHTDTCIHTQGMWGLYTYFRFTNNMKHSNHWIFKIYNWHWNNASYSFIKLFW